MPLYCGNGRSICPMVPVKFEKGSAIPGTIAFADAILAGVAVAVGSEPSARYFSGVVLIELLPPLPGPGRNLPMLAEYATPSVICGVSDRWIPKFQFS